MPTIHVNTFRLTLAVSLVGAWVSILTLLGAYLLYSGRYALVSTSPSGSATAHGDYSHAAMILSMEADAFGAGPGRESKAIADVDTMTSWRRIRSNEKEVEAPAGPEGVSAIEKLDQLDSRDPRAGFKRVEALSALLPKLRNISRIETPTPEAFRNYIAPMGLPVIMTGVFQGTKMSNWDWKYLRDRWGDRVFHNTRQGNYSTKSNVSGKRYIGRVSVRLSDFIDIVTGVKKPRQGEDGLYITKQDVIPPEDLEKEFYYPPFYPDTHKTCYLQPSGWIGVPKTFTQGHIDSKDNFVYQIIGEKQWTIFSPQDYKYLYYTQKRGTLEWSSALSSLDHPDLEKFPLYANTSPITFVLKAGEVLYLPRGWTHFVVNLTPTFMINTWRYGPAAITESWSEEDKEEIHRRCY